MLERTIWLLALSILGEEPAGGHTLLVKLMQEAAAVAFHAQAAKPMPADRLVKEKGFISREYFRFF